jgi:hypothetical protein
MPTLTELRVKAAKSAEKPYKLFDQRGLSCSSPLLADVYGASDTNSLGAYPEVSLKRARDKRDDTRRQLADGVDPTFKRRAEADSTTNTFKAVADDFNWSAATQQPEQ